MFFKTNRLAGQTQKQKLDIKSEYQTIFIVYSSKRPQIMYKSVEKT